MQPLIKRQLVAGLIMTAGSALVFSTVLYMNQQEKPPKEIVQESSVEFTVEKKPPPKKKEVKPKQRPKPRHSSAPAPKAPDLSSAISAVGIEFGGLQGVSLELSQGDVLGSFDDKGPMTEGALDSPPRVRARAGSQDYPTQARKDGLEGYVLLNIYVRHDGSVGGVKVLDAKPRGIFEPSAKNYVSEWTFEPGVYEGAPVDAWVKQKVVFKLQRS